MNSPLIYLTLCSVRNRLAKRLRRLREPRYLFGSVIGFGYLFLVFGRSYFVQRRYAPPGGGRAGLLDALGGSLGGQLGAAALLLLLVALAWTLPSRRPAALAFTRADVQFLFTAPIPRWRLVRYRVVRSQLGAFIGTAIVTLILHPANVFQGWRFFCGFWLVMATINLHTTGITLMRGQAAERGQLTFVRRWLPTAIAFAYVTLIAVDVLMRWSATVGAAGTPQDALSAAVQVAASGLSGALLWPFLAIVRLPLSDSGLAFLAALPWTLLAIALNYVWVLRTDAPFEEASAELADKLARVRKEGVKALRRPRPAVKTPFKLAAVGPSEIAIVWKNLISMGRMVSWTTMIRFGPLVIVLVAFLGRRGGGTGGRADALALVSLFVAAFAMILGPQVTRADLRQDLPNLGVLRTWPLRGATIVRGEVLAPAALLVSIAWLALVTAAVVSTQGSLHRQLGGNVWSYLLAAMAVAPGIVLVQLLVQNALAVTFPAWVAVGPPRGGIDVMGQRMLLMTASFLGLALTLLPAALAGGIVLFIVQAITGRLLIVLPGLLAAIVLLGEAFLGSELLGAVLDRTDVTALDPSES